MNDALSVHLITIAYRLKESDDDLDQQASAFILKAEGEARREQGQRVARVIAPRPGGYVRVGLKGGAVGWVPARMVQEALEND